MRNKRHFVSYMMCCHRDLAEASTGLQLAVLGDSRTYLFKTCGRRAAWNLNSGIGQ